MEKITSINSKKFKYLKKLYQCPSKSDKFLLVEGPNQINAAKKLIITDYSDILSKNLMDKISNSHQNKIALMKKPCFSLNDFQKMNKIIVLDEIQDPGNVGTIIRTAVAFGIDGILLTNKSANIWSCKVIRATAGSIFDIPIIQNVSVKEIQSLNHNIYSTTLSHNLSSNNILFLEWENIKELKKIKNNSIIVFGNEKKGVSPELAKYSFQKITIPISEKIDSLNVAISAGIILNMIK